MCPGNKGLYLVLWFFYHFHGRLQVRLRVLEFGGFRVSGCEVSGNFRDWGVWGKGFSVQGLRCLLCVFRGYLEGHGDLVSRLIMG